MRTVRETQLQALKSETTTVMVERAGSRQQGRQTDRKTDRRTDKHTGGLRDR